MLVIAETAFGVNQRATATAKPGFVNADAVGPGDKGYDAVSRGQINQAQAQLSKSLARNAVSAGASSINTNLPTFQNVQLPGSSGVAVAATGDVRRYSAVSTGELRDAESQAGLDVVSMTALPVYQNIDLRAQNGAGNGR